MCLDVLRAITREPKSIEAMLAELDLTKGADQRLDSCVLSITDMLAHPEHIELRSRLLVERFAIALQASLLIRRAPAPVAQAYTAARLGEGGCLFGTLPTEINTVPILDRFT